MVLIKRPKTCTGTLITDNYIFLTKPSPAFSWFLPLSSAVRKLNGPEGGTITFLSKRQKPCVSQAHSTHIRAILSLEFKAPGLDEILAAFTDSKESCGKIRENGK